MFSRFSKKKTTRKENPPPINPNMEGILNNAMANRRPHQTSVIGVDPANPQGQTPGNSIIAGSSAPADPAEVLSSPSTSSTSVIGVDPANPQGQMPGNSIIAGPSAPADPAEVSSTPTSLTSEIGVDPANPQGQTPGNSIIAGPSAPSDPANSLCFSPLFLQPILLPPTPEMFSCFGKKKTTRKETPSYNPTMEGLINNASRIQQARQTSVIGVDPANPQGQTPGNSIIAGPSAPADPAEVSSSPSTLSTSEIGVDPANPQGQTLGNSIIAEPSAPADPAQVSSSPSTSSTSAQALPKAGGRRRISSSISIGQDQAFHDVCKFLTEDDVGIVGIYGTGGVGKTTLMNKVWYEFLEPSNFKVLFIVVSDIVNVDRIQQDIMKEMDLPFEKDIHHHRRARDINKAIASSRRKLSLLFDDIWEAIDLYEIGVLGEMSFDTSILKIIFTTRLEDVCSQMQPDRDIKIQPLGWDDSWALFAKHVGTKTLHSSHNQILDLAKSVAEECKGLPLALVVVGKAMTCKYSREAWADALYNLQKSPGSEERLFSTLKLTYDNIENNVEKECFLFCCLYPEYRRIHRRELVEFWIGDGILDLVGSYHETCNRGYAIIDRLSAMCLVELEDEDCLTMHDIIRNMGLWIASELKFFVHGEHLKLTEDKIRNRWEEANGMYVLKGDDLPEQPHCQNLSTLIFDIKKSMIPKLQNSFLQFMDKLRILKMDNLTFVDTTFEIVGQFTELRWLRIRNTNLEKFPSVLGNLRKLNVLQIEFKRGLDSLPPAIGQLRELRKLWITGSIVIKCLPLELGELSKLEELVLPTDYVVNFINLIPNGIFEHMRELRRLELSVTSMGILPADLWNLSKLEHLLIEASGLVAVDIFDMYESPPLSIDGLKQLSKSLRTLEMKTWPIFKWADLGSALETMNEMSELSIVKFPLDEIILTSKRLEKLDISRCPRLVKLQVGGDALKCLCSLTIWYCDSLKHIIGLEYLEHLKFLRIEACPKLEGEFMNPNEGIRSLPHLESLRLYSLPQVTTICSDHVSFPSLLHLRIDECQKLEKFPRGLMNEKRPLQGLIGGTKVWWEGLQWQDEDFKSYLSSLFLKI